MGRKQSKTKQNKTKTHTHTQRTAKYPLRRKGRGKGRLTWLRRRRCRRCKSPRWGKLLSSPSSCPEEASGWVGGTQKKHTRPHVGKLRCQHPGGGGGRKGARQQPEFSFHIRGQAKKKIRVCGFVVHIPRPWSLYQSGCQSPFVWLILSINKLVQIKSTRHRREKSSLR